MFRRVQACTSSALLQAKLCASECVLPLILCASIVPPNSANAKVNRGPALEHLPLRCAHQRHGVRLNWCRLRCRRLDLDHHSRGHALRAHNAEVLPVCVYDKLHTRSYPSRDLDLHHRSVVSFSVASTLVVPANAISMRGRGK